MTPPSTTIRSPAQIRAGGRPAPEVCFITSLRQRRQGCFKRCPRFCGFWRFHAGQVAPLKQKVFFQGSASKPATEFQLAWELQWHQHDGYWWPIGLHLVTKQKIQLEAGVTTSCFAEDGQNMAKPKAKPKRKAKAKSQQPEADKPKAPVRKRKRGCEPADVD